MSGRLKFIIISIVIILLVIGVVLFTPIFKNNNNNNNNNTNNTNENNEQNEVKEEKKDTKITSVIYRCYRHKDDIITKDNITYSYTKYYEFSSLNNIVSEKNTKLVYVYKFNSKDDYKNFTENKHYNNDYKITNNEAELTYTVSQNILLIPKEKEDDIYNLDRYLISLSEQGYTSCEETK